MKIFFRYFFMSYYLPFSSDSWFFKAHQTGAANLCHFHCGAQLLFKPAL